MGLEAMIRNKKSTGRTKDLADVEALTFMTNAPCILGPRVLKRLRVELSQRWPDLYRERAVADDYLSAA